MGKEIVHKLDERGRITLGIDTTKEYGKSFIVVKAPKEIVLKPLVTDPIKLLQKEGEKLPKGISIKHIRGIAYEEAVKEALTNIERLEGLSSQKLKGKSKNKKR